MTVALIDVARYRIWRQNPPTSGMTRHSHITKKSIPDKLDKPLGEKEKTGPINASGTADRKATIRMNDKRLSQAGSCHLAPWPSILHDEDR